MKIHLIEDDKGKAICGRGATGSDTAEESKVTCKLCKRVLKKRIADEIDDAAEPKSAGQPMAYGTAEELQEAIDLYFYELEDRDETGKVINRNTPLISGLAYALNIETRTLVNYEKREEYFPIIKRAKQKVEMDLERRLHGTAATGAIFGLKANFRWPDSNKVDHTSSDGSMTPKANGEPLTKEDILAELEKRGLPASVFDEK